MPEEQTTRTFGFWAKLATGAAMVVLATTVASATTGISEVRKVVKAIIPASPIKLKPDVLTGTFPGKPQTILIIGSDTIGKGETEVGREVARSDTLILLRLDPNRGATAVMSIPRDLKVEIPGYGADKINAAYALGGPELTLETVKDVTGLPINHVINVDLAGFTEVVDKLGCVYVDVDRRYYNDSLEYIPIDLQPGYQKLCGPQALSYARYRHEDTDLVRGARQQEFLSAFKAQNPPAKLFRERDKLIQVFINNTKSDIATEDDAKNLLEIALKSARNPIQEVHFQADVGPTYVEASDEQMRNSTAEFIGVKASKGPRGTLTPEDTPSANEVGTVDEQKFERAQKKGAKPSKRKTPEEQKQSALEDATTEGETQAQQAKDAGANFPVCYPTLRTTGSVYAGEPRVYGIGVGADVGSGGERERFDAYRIVLKRGGVGEYYGIQGTTWQNGKLDPKNPPILEGEHSEREINGRKFDVYFDGDRVRLVAWRSQRGVYWLSNTLLETLSAKEMLKIAGNTRCS
jgi:LCP family protein required for cell wall assembly